MSMVGKEEEHESRELAAYHTDPGGSVIVSIVHHSRVITLSLRLWLSPVGNSIRSIHLGVSAATARLCHPSLVALPTWQGTRCSNHDLYPTGGGAAACVLRI